MYQRVSQRVVRCTVYPQLNLTGWYQYRYLNTQVMNFSTGLGSIWNPYAIFFLKNIPVPAEQYSCTSTCTKDDQIEIETEILVNLVYLYRYSLKRMYS